MANPATDPYNLAGAVTPAAGLAPFTPSSIGSPLSAGTGFGGPTSLPSLPDAGAAPVTSGAPAAASTGGTSLGDALTPSNTTLGLLGAGAAGLYQQSRAQSQNQGYVNQLQQIAQPSLQAGNTYLNRALSGALTPAQQAQQNALLAQGNTLTQEAAPYLAAGAAGLQAYQSGQLPAWQQQQLDNQTAAAIAQLKASLGPNVDSSTLAAGIQQIQEQAGIAKGQLLQQNLATAENEYGIGTQQQAAAFQAINAGYQSAVTDAQQSFEDAISALTLGDQATLAAIQTAIQGNSQIASATSGLFGNLAMSYAMMQGKGGGGSSSIMSGIKNLFGGSSAASSGSTDTYTSGGTTEVPASLSQDTGTSSFDPNASILQAPADVTSFIPSDYGT